MYAYGKKYNADRVVLIYPKSDDIGEAPIAYVSDDGVQVEVVFVDLREEEESVWEIVAMEGGLKRLMGMLV